MQYKPVAIDPRNGFDLVAVWQKDGSKWQLLQLARPQSAIALAREYPRTRLVFPIGINPNKPRKNRRHKNISQLIKT
ncbi:hypothetical protein [Chlorogloea sp. CCALA 695]|uniref:hypothetical protein n=1 Tax=Chlorogloea sp. CCALA 695 TaxID=2107693 RepID=UPI000D0800FE|nr:hypothetical protein [Chlorogloea sp. CCALA 695]PSB26104.1 hypothetical protein C7B70_24315 [Chlorogloea sp. CCALA 695]